MLSRSPANLGFYLQKEKSTSLCDLFSKHSRNLSSSSCLQGCGISLWNQSSRVARPAKRNNRQNKRVLPVSCSQITPNKCLQHTETRTCPQQSWREKMVLIKRENRQNCWFPERLLLNHYKQPHCSLQWISPSQANSNHSLVVRQSSSDALLSSPHLHNWEPRRPPCLAPWSLVVLGAPLPLQRGERGISIFSLLKITPSSPKAFQSPSFSQSQEKKSNFFGKGDALNFQGLRFWEWENRVNPIKLNGNSWCHVKKRGELRIEQPHHIRAEPFLGKLLHI